MRTELQLFEEMCCVVSKVLRKAIVKKRNELLSVTYTSVKRKDISVQICIECRMQL